MGAIRLNATAIVVDKRNDAKKAGAFLTGLVSRAEHRRSERSGAMSSGTYGTLVSGTSATKPMSTNTQTSALLLNAHNTAEMYWCFGQKGYL